MKPHHIAVAALSMALAACTPPPAESAQPTTVPPPAATPTPAPLPAPLPQDSAAKRAPGDQSPTMAIFRAFGTEPFWNVNVEGDSLTFTTPEDQAGVLMQGERRSIADGVEVTGSHDGKAFALRVIAGACSDGMSDNEYHMTASFHFGDAAYTGCGEAAK